MDAASSGSDLEMKMGRGPSFGEGHFGRASNADSVAEDEEELLWAAVERLPSTGRHNFSIRPMRLRSRLGAKDVIDVRNLDRAGREKVVNQALDTPDQDNYVLLSRIRQRLERVGLKIPTVEVRFQDLTVSGDVYIGVRALPTLPNYVRDVSESLLTKLGILRSKKHKLTILKNISGAIRPGRMTLLLGPPASGKTTLLLALAGKLDSDLKTTGDVTYNGHGLDEFSVARTAAYVSQTDNHIGELTVRETLDFAAKCQGASEALYAGYVHALTKLEKEKKIRPMPEIDAFMKAISVKGEKHNLITDYMVKVLGLDNCADVVVGSEMVRGVSGGQRRRVTSGEMLVGPRKTLFMDDISTGLDSSTTYQIVKCFRNFVHQMESTILMSLLQPPPETFDLFDDIILLSEGQIVYQGPRECVLDFFKSLGFFLPPRKAIPDFLQEVTSKKDQELFWLDPSRPYVYLTVDKIVEAFKRSQYWISMESILSVMPEYDKDINDSFPSSSPLPSALIKSKYAVSRWELLKACLYRESLLIHRHKFLYIFKTCQIAFIGFIASTIFIRTRIHPTDELNGSIYLSCLFFSLINMMLSGSSELSITISRLPVFYKHRDNVFHPPWAFAISTWLLQLPYSIIAAFVWSCVVYYTTGFSPEPGRFVRFMLILFATHQMALGLFKMMGSIARDMVVAMTVGFVALSMIYLLGGFMVPKDIIKPWWRWGYWVSPLTYGQLAISINEFTSTRWMNNSSVMRNSTIGHNVLRMAYLPTGDYWYWLGIGVLMAYSCLFNILFTIFLVYLKPPSKVQTIIVSKSEGGSQSGPTSNGYLLKQPTTFDKVEEVGNKRGIVLPFKPLSMSFLNVNYFVEMPQEMKVHGVEDNKLQLLSNVSGVFRPGVLTALVGSSGAGKTTLMDVLAGRKTGGYIEGDIRISGYQKEQHSFARILGYVEQTDIHSPQITVEESLWFSSYLRLPKETSQTKRKKFVEEVMALMELDTLRYALVGLHGSTGLSTEQRKRLTIAVELVANPSIIFMDEPTSGLDARAAAVVMRTVRKTVDTGRTVVCTIHQPSINIFEAFDELLLMKRGGRVIYGGSLGFRSQDMISYFQAIDGVSPIHVDCNPANWMLEITTQACEDKLGIDFAEVYRMSNQFREVESLIQQSSEPELDTEPIKFSSKYSQSIVSQFMACYRKQNLVYWRSPRYNVVRLFYTALSALLFGSIFWNLGSKRETRQNLMVLMGTLYVTCVFSGVNNASSVQPMVSIERTVYYRERAAGMYSALPYALAQAAVEIPYIALQTIIFGVITYFMINYERDLGKFLMYLGFMFLTFTYFTFYGMMIISLTPSQHLAAVISSAFYSLWSLLAGFLIPKPKIPVWWVWLYYMTPMAWTLSGIISSQFGDDETRLAGSGFDGTVKEFLDTQLGFSSGIVGVSAIVLVGFIVLFFSVYATAIKFLNFQKR